ncbi:hypothetical protein [Aureibacter tunicatorum]|uniref:DUF5723 domain-containing protein n=1 Tax=Aureibacter tunicatorum TaxID=866807 RepID=A0AAE3XR91_9BACT|nr:hypothetical protein [Aureibacter tunicatorum]MDR6241293.1 hypothetical protein [Aureibacter tunicatorum]BDD03553.1 hypothetical protein AUTU_10360 [Aureibacter tunicatorum]
MKRVLTLAAAIVMIFLNGRSFGQEKVNTLGQVSFAYPIGTNGFESMDYVNDFSFNIIYGMNGGVNGFELGSVMNYNQGNVSGFQIGGVTNITMGYQKGFSLSGVANIVKDSIDGFGLSGVANLMNANSKGVFISGAANLAKGNVKGFQLSTINVTNGELDGFGLGVVNVTRKLKGAQFGVVNVVGSEEGATPIGLINVVKGGLYEIELAGGEALYANVNFKMGVEKFYTIFKAGYSTHKGEDIFSYGLGFGTNIALSSTRKHNLVFDLSANQLVRAWDWDYDEINLLNKLDITYKYRLNDHISFFAGPSFNVYVTGLKVDGEYGSLEIPYTLFESESSKNKTYGWIGANAGVSFRL